MEKSPNYYFIKHLDFANIHLSFKDCQYFPCHMKIKNHFNCLFCYCPFYPCFNKNKGGTTSKSGIWDCSECTFVHRDDVVKRIMELLYENKDFKTILSIIDQEFS